MTQPSWVTKDDELSEPPMFVESFEDALEWYGSVYDKNGMGKLPPTIGLPSAQLDDPSLCMILSAAASAAATRTKEQLQKMRNSIDFELYGNNFLDISMETGLLPERFKI